MAKSGIQTRATLAIIIITASAGLCGCFTGIEGTKKITLTKEDRKALAPTPEDIFMDTVKSLPLKDWAPGKTFYVADDKSSLVYDNITDPAKRTTTPKSGDTLYYEQTGTRLMPDGSQRAVVYFISNGTRYAYNTGQTPEKALTETTSDKLPMIIDLEMVEASRRLLKGRHLWTRTPLRYDSTGARINGLKFIEVVVSDVQPGDMVFPLNLQVKDPSGRPQWLKINYGNTGIESRSFSNLFYLSDIRQKYPQISDTNWILIQQGKVIDGMTKEECRLSLGAPSDVDKGHDYSQTLDLWKYPNGTVLYFEDGLLVNHR